MVEELNITQVVRVKDNVTDFSQSEKVDCVSESDQEDSIMKISVHT